MQGPEAVDPQALDGWMTFLSNSWRWRRYQKQKAAENKRKAKRWHAKCEASFQYRKTRQVDRRSGEPRVERVDQCNHIQTIDSSKLNPGSLSRRSKRASEVKANKLGFHARVEGLSEDSCTPHNQDSGGSGVSNGGVAREGGAAAGDGLAFNSRCDKLSPFVVACTFVSC